MNTIGFYSTSDRNRAVVSEVEGVQKKMKHFCNGQIIYLEEL
jgi:hypothetical protein